MFGTTAPRCFCAREVNLRQCMYNISRGTVPLPPSHGAPTTKHCPAVCKAAELNDPAFQSEALSFDHRQYWDERYRSEGHSYEWYRPYKTIQPVLAAHICKDASVLQVGVGTSTIQEDMAYDGYAEVVNVDYSPVCIAIMQNRRPIEGLSYEVADCRSMPQYEGGRFDAVLDKGTLDALLCADDDTGNTSQMLQEVARTIRVGGCYIWITSGAPKARLPYLDSFGSHDIVVYEIGQQGSLMGPVSRNEALQTFPTMVYSHFAYVLTKL